MSFLERMPYALLIALAVIMAIVPPGQSHLLEKTRMLFSGTLKRPLDWAAGIVVVIGALVGYWTFRRMNEKVFTNVALALSAVASVFLIIHG